MGKILPRHFFYAIIVFSMLIAGGFSVISEVRDMSRGAETGVEIMSQEDITHYNESLSVQDLETNVDEIKDKIEDLKPESKWGVIDALSLPIAFIQIAWDAVKLVITSFGMMDDSIEGLADVFGLPGWVSTFAILLIVALLIFSILSLIFGKDI